MALALQLRPPMTILDNSTLAAVRGGDGEPQPAQPAQPAKRSWNQFAADYVASCATTATNAAVFQGRPGSWQQLAITGAIGCAAGIATQAAQDWRARASAK
ncbi:MAG TPA: hypothetical protein VMZ53_30300 [Kofleriaceae bacterium]|nr:hypothetical protein [Kofleriaceae bacterium]